MNFCLPKKMSLKIVLLGFYFFICCASFQAKSSNSFLRERFKEWQETYKDLDQIQQQQILKDLVNYPLYPYAWSDYLTDPRNKISYIEINFFESKFSNFPNLLALKQKYVTNLTQQQNWKAITQLNDNSSIALKCQLIYADYKLKPRLIKLKKVGEIWAQGIELPSSCDPLFEIWSKTPYKTNALVLNRTHLLLQNNQRKLAKMVVNQLPNSAKSTKNAILSVIANPKTLPRFVASQPNKPELKAIALDLFASYSVQDMNGALSLMQKMQKKYRLTQSEKIKLSDRLAQTYFNSDDPVQIKWRQKYNARSKNTGLIEQEIRLALRNNDKKARDKWINLLPKEAKQKVEWRYWLAINLNEKGKKEQAMQLLTKLSTERGFYGLMSAQQLNIPYQINLEYELVPNMSQEDAQKWIQNKYQNLKEVLLIKELKMFNMSQEAKKEWLLFINRQASEHQAQLAKFAFDQNWEVESVQATIAGKHWDNWNERLPIVYVDIYSKALQDKAISLSCSLAIARQESGLDPFVQSPVGARGLMQLMPATAKEMAKITNQTDYISSADLFNPEINIALGTSFLDLVYERFDQNRILASAAYNAGPNRVDQWLKQSNNQLDAMAFIESIPFSETRNYVKNVLTYDYLYQTLMYHKQQKMLTDKESSRLY